MIDEIKLQQMINENPKCKYNYIDNEFGKRFILYTFFDMELYRAYGDEADECRKTCDDLNVLSIFIESWRTRG